MEKIRHVQRIKRPNGRIDLYFRKGDFREGPLLSPDGTPALQAEVDAILKRIAQAAQAAKPRAGTVGAMLKQYNRSAEFLALARTAQASRMSRIHGPSTSCSSVSPASSAITSNKRCES